MLGPNTNSAFRFHYRIKVQLAFQGIRVPLVPERGFLDIVRSQLALALEKSNGSTTGCEPELASGSGITYQTRCRLLDQIVRTGGNAPASNNEGRPS